MREITDIREMQSVALSILKYFDKVCGENGLKYFVADGTLLGTIRHQGFIPWDDDIDVWMPRDDYEKLEGIVNGDGNQTFRFLNHKNTRGYFWAYGKLVHTGTYLREPAAGAVETGIFIDVFPYDGLPEKGSAEYERHWDRLLFLESQRVNGFRTYREFLKGGRGGIVKWCKWAIRKCYGGPRIIRKMEKECRKYPVEGSKYVACLCGGYRRSDVMPKEAVDRVIRKPFEDYLVNVPVGYEKYLETEYGDYMKLPPVEQRVGHISIAGWKDGETGR